MATKTFPCLLIMKFAKIRRRERLGRRKVVKVFYRGKLEIES